MKKILAFSFAVCVTTALAACGSSFSSSDYRYVAIGASDAVGIGAIPPSKGYVFLIEDELDRSCGDTELNNLGIPGVEADEIENVEVPAANALSPDLITIFVGGNDIVGGRSPEVFRNDLRDILMTLRDETSADIYIGNLPDLTQLPRFQDDPDPAVTSERVAAFNAVIAEEAAAVGAILVDVMSAGFTEAEVSQDGFHPSNEGHDLLADLFLAQIVPQFCGEPAPTSENAAA